MELKYPPDANHAVGLCVRQLERFAAVRAALTSAIERCDEAALTAALAEAAAAGVDMSEVRQAEGLLSRLRKVRALAHPAASPSSPLDHSTTPARLRSAAASLHAQPA